MREPPVLLFDIGGVIVDNVGFERLAALADGPVDVDALKRRWLRCPVARAFELGRSSAAEFATDFVAAWGLRTTPATFITEFAAWPRGYFPGAVELLRTLRRTHRIGCLANSNALHWARLDGFDALFDVALSSHEIGLMKPDPACFAYAAARCGVEPHDVIFFDDAAPNVEAARNAGMRAYRVDGPAGIRECLARDGVAI